MRAASISAPSKSSKGLGDRHSIPLSGGNKKAEETNPPLTLPVEQRTFPSPVPFDFPTSYASGAMALLIA